ncbi:MAG: hypothetical protein WCF94_01575 [bacterium]
MKTNIITQNIERLDNHSKIIFWGLVSFLVLSIVVRVVLFGAMTLNGVNESALKSKMSKMSVDVQMLEHEYISAKSGITMDFAMAKGFVSTSKTNYITVQPNTVSLTLNTNN